MAVNIYEMPLYDEGDKVAPKLVSIGQAESSLIRALDGSLAVRNNLDVRDIPEQVSTDLDRLVCFIEKTDFEDMKTSVGACLHKRQMRQLNSGPLGMVDGSSSEEIFPVPAVITSAVANQVISAFAYDRFMSVNSRHLHGLYDLDLTSGLPKETAQQDRAVMRVMVSAIGDIESGMTLSESSGAKALGYDVRKSAAPYIGKLSLFR